jgi:amidohydrolase
MIDKYFKEIVDFRHFLHEEFETEKSVIKQLKNYNPDEIIKFDTQTGVAFVFDSGNAGKTVVFRAELDALPIQELNDELKYQSKKSGVAHLCGHDGHMSILVALAKLINDNRPKSGKVVLLFQPAEEEKQGAEKIVKDSKFIALKPDYIFALHNIPGQKKNTVLFKHNEFAAASMGMHIKLFGKTSHAGHPENGISPTQAIADIINKFNEIENNKSEFEDYTLKTFIHIKLGEIAYGTSPGYADIMITLRAYKNKDINKLAKLLEKEAKQIATKEKLKVEISYNEVFPATVNKKEASELLLNSLNDLDFVSLQIMDNPFTWSEDFGYYSEKYNTAFLGYGSGESQPQLHNPNFDFPDDIIPNAAKLFYQLYINILNNK